jgi:GNAT superfamily N-acetyltransferase
VVGLKIVTAADRPDLIPEIRRLGASPWPDFLDHDDVVNEYWRFLYELVPDYQFALLEQEGGDVIAMGNSVPIVWDGHRRTLPAGGIDAVLAQGIGSARSGTVPTAASALMIVVRPDRLRQGLSATCIRAMAQVVWGHGLGDLVAPVRPTDKHRYPLIPMERYARWRRADGSLYDPWLRVHERVGGEPVGIAPAAMTVRGSVRDWERWTGMALPESGTYIVPGGLVPVEVDTDRDEGLYIEPGFWMHHRCRPDQA